MEIDNPVVSFFLNVSNTVAEECVKARKDLMLYRQAFRLACEKCKRAYDLEYLSCDCKIGSVASFEKQFLEQARELLKNRGVKNVNKN